MQEKIRPGANHLHRWLVQYGLVCRRWRDEILSKIHEKDQYQGAHLQRDAAFQYRNVTTEPISEMKRKKNIDPAQLELALFHEPEVEDTCEAMTEAMPIPPTEMSDMTKQIQPEQEAPTREPRLWHDDGWTARVIRNEHDEGWAVEMTKDGEAEPALVGPWTMGRDKKNPKPLDAAAFATLVKTASEVRRRHEQQLHAMLHKSVTVAAGATTVTVTLDIVPEEDNSYAMLAAYDETGAQLAQARVAPDFKLTKASAAAWMESGFLRPGRS